ncbi:MAG: hypothetical protein NZ824_10855 [Candidatus Thioglobus sp.]|nr:hypothetical protein [Candidatus Thioglobus sp.]
MSRITDYIIEQEESGRMIYVEGQGYVRPEDYAHKYMKTEAFRKEFDKAFSVHKRREK